MELSLLAHLCCINCAYKLKFWPFPFQLKSKHSFFPKKNNKNNNKEENFSNWLNKYCLSPDQEVNRKIYRNGLFICPNCSRWYPVINYIPEILPDHLRDWGRDLAFLEKQKWQLDSGLKKYLIQVAHKAKFNAKSIIDSGLKFKKAEMNIKDKVDDPLFFGPGYLAPFNPQNPEFTRQLIRRFGQVIYLLELQNPVTILDVGAGYAWTSEWLAKAGHNVIALDICRTYLEIGAKRMMNLPLPLQPELLVADVEAVPFQGNIFDAILCFDAFHHVPDRKKALRHLWRTLKPGGQIVLAEPGPQHEKEPSSIKVMEKFGILEKGMSLEDVQSYAEDLENAEIKQVYIVKVDNDEIKPVLFPASLKAHKFTDCNYYVIRKKERGNY